MDATLLTELCFFTLVASVLSTASSVLVATLADRHAIFSRISLYLLALAALCAMVSAGLMLAGASVLEFQLPVGLPWLAWHFRLDLLSAYFLGLIGIVVFAVAIFAPAYVLHYRREGYSLALLGVFTGLFVLGMQLVVLANDAFSFMISWELMSLSSYFLVVFEHKQSANRRAAFIYLLMATVSALVILLAFGVLAAFSEDMTFDAFRQVSLTPGWSMAAFTLALIGFGLKAGLFPLHVWLPEAHPVAPSHISALMSGVMLKVAVYGFIRYLLEFAGELQVEWGVVLLLIGSVTALYGVLYALMQHDLKKLLAYHSVENIGIIYIGLGLAVIFSAAGFPHLGVLGLIAALYHTLNHAIFKSLLFLGAGAIVQRGHERNLERMGGLISRMPWTAAFFLLGCISISALPPFNGFVSEWLTFQTMLQAVMLESGVLRALIPVAAAMLALTGALAAACFVKVFGVAFLGKARAKRVRHAHEATPGMVFSQGYLALLCLLLGVLPTLMVANISKVTHFLTGASLAANSEQGWLWLTPMSTDQASYSAPLVLTGVLLACFAWLSVFILARARRKQHPVQRVDIWDCGFGGLNPRMQYGATAFAMPIREIFSPVLRINQEVIREMDEVHGTRPVNMKYHIHSGDIAWDWLYLPIERLLNRTTLLVGRLQSGYLRHYLAYSFFTLIFLLWVAT